LIETVQDRKLDNDLCNIWNYAKLTKSYRAFHGFWQAKFPNGGSVLGLSQFSILPQLHPKILLNPKVVKIDPDVIISLC